MKKIPFRSALALGPFVFGSVALAQPSSSSSGRNSPSADIQIAAAVLPAPMSMRAAAGVLGYDAGGRLVPLRTGTNELICLADDPGDNRFHVACYHRDLEPFMARGRELRARGMKDSLVRVTRESEIAAGKLSMPSHPSSLYELFGPVDSYDAATNSARNASPVYVVYIPYATPQSTGLSEQPLPNGPWIMNPGKPWAHIMIVPEQPKSPPPSAKP